MGKKRKKQFSGLMEKPLFEGVLIRNQNKYSLEVRKSDGELSTVVKNVEANPDKVIKKIPFVRGVFVLFQNIILLLEALEYSAEYFGNDTSKETAIDKILVKLFGKHTNMIVTAVTAVFSFVLCMLALMFVPVFASTFLQRYIVNKSVIHIIEFVVYIIILIIYFTSFLLYKDVRRMMKYHAAAHQCINCLERGRKLNYKNVASSSRFFGRCTTNYIAFCVFVSTVLFAFVRIDSVPLRLLFRLIYIPLATGLFYELFYVISHISDGVLYKILTFPTMFFECFSLFKPDDEMIDTAIASLEAVFDWKEFLVINFPEKYSPSDFGMDAKEKKEAVEKLIETEELIEEEFAKIDEEILEGARFYVDENGDYVKLEEGYYIDENGEEIYIDENGEEYYVENVEISAEDYYENSEFVDENFDENEAEALAKATAIAKAKAEAEAKAKAEAEEKAKAEAEAKAKAEAEEKAKAEAEAKAKAEAEEKAKEEAETVADAETEEKAAEEDTKAEEKSEVKAEDNKSNENSEDEFEDVPVDESFVAEDFEFDDEDEEEEEEILEEAPKKLKGKAKREAARAERARRKEEKARLKAEAKAKKAKSEADIQEDEQARIEEEALAEQERLEEEARLAEEAKLKEEAAKVEKAKREKEAAKAEKAKREKEARLAEEAALAEKARLEEEARLAEEARIVEEEALAAEQAKFEEEARLAEEAALAEKAKREGTAKAKKAEKIKNDKKEKTGKTGESKGKGVNDLTKTQPVSIDFDDDYGFDPEDEEVPENQMVFEPVDENTVDLTRDKEALEDIEEGDFLFSKDIESIPMPESLDNIVEYMPEGGVMSRIYNLNAEEAEKNEFDDDDDIDFDNIIDENGHLTLKDTDAFNRKLDEEYDEIFKRLGLDADDL